MAKNKTINMVKSQVIYKDYSKDAERTALVSGENLAHMFGKIARWYTDISWVGHTHTEANITDFGTYAGASTKGGAATSANKLNIGSADIGSETKPVYFSYLTGKPVACTYSLNASVPANAVFTDINVKQSPSTADESREVLFAGNTGNTETTGTVGKSNKLYFNPSTGALTATSFSGSIAASNLTGTIDAGRLPTTAVTAGSYGPAAGGTLTYGGTFDVPYVTVDKYGRLTGASTKTFTMPAQYTHPTTSGNKHIPSGGSSGQYLKWSSDGTATWSAIAAADLPSHTHEYLPLAGGTMTGDLAFTAVTSTEYPAVSNQISFGGSTDGGQIFFEVQASDAGALVIQTTDDPNAKIVFRNKVTSGGTRANEVTITDGVISGNGSGLTNIVSAGKWTTARTITIGSTGKSVDGSGNVSWTLAEIGAAASSHTHSYLPLSGGTMTGVISSTVTTSTHIAGNKGTAIINSTAGAGYNMLAKMKSSNGVFTIGTYNDKFSLYYTTDTIISAGTNTTTYDILLLNEAGNTQLGRNLYFPQKADGIYYTGTKATSRLIRFMDNTSDAYGNGIGIGGGGVVCIGSGEASDALIDASIFTPGSETLYLASDEAIILYSNCQTIGNRVGIVYDSSGRLRPDTNNTRMLGGSDYYWNAAYITQTIGGYRGSWISARTNATIKNISVDRDSYTPVISCKSTSGEWSIGTLGTNEYLYISYTTDANYSAGSNRANTWYFNSDGWYSGTASKADKWTTARTITIGSTGKSVDGSGNVSWSLSEIGAAATSHSHSNYLPQATPTSTPDLNTYTTTGIYHIGLSATNAPVTQHSTVYVEAGVGTPYQLFKPDNVDTVWYTRHKITDGWSDWVALKLTDTVYIHPTYTSKASGLYKITVDGTGHVSATAAVTASDLPAHTHSYLPLSGGTMTGTIGLVANKYGVSETALNCNNSNITGVNRIIFADLADSSQEGLSFYRSSNVYDNFWIKNGVIYFTPNRTNEEGNDPTTYTVYHSGNLTYSTIGAAPASHTHSYLPLSGGIVTGGITYKGATYDISAADNGVTTTVWPSTFNLIDKSDRIFTRLEGILYTNGDVGCQLYVRNYNTSGTQVAQKGITFIMNKSGSLSWSVSDPANFRTAINAAAADHTHGTLYNSFTSSVSTTTNTWAAAGLNGTGHVIKSIRTEASAPAYLLSSYAAGIGFGGSDTRGVISIRYDAPSVRFAGGNQTNVDGGTAKWYFTLSATSAQTYTFPASGGTLTDIIYKASNYYATSGHTHSYIPLAGSTAITGNLRTTMGSTSGPYISVSNGTYEIGLHVGSGGVNHGIYDFSSSVNAWMCYHDGTKNIFNGQANTAVTATKSTYTDHSPSITIQTGSSAQAKISLQTLINWLINTKKVLPSGVFIHKIIQSGWSYAANDILQLTCSGTNYEIQLAGVALEFIGTVSSYNTGEFRMMIHTSPTISFTVTSGYKAGPTSSTFVYTCNGSEYTPTWRLISNGLKYANGYWGLTDPSGGDADWTRTTSLGIIPYQSGGLNAGHQSIGTSSWYFSHAYIDNFHGCTLTLGSSSVQGRIEIQSTTTASVSYNSANPRIRFKNAGGDQNIDIIMSDFDSVRAPAAISIHGNQGGEYLLAPNVASWDYTNNKWTALLRTFTEGTTSTVGQGRVIAGNGTKKGVAGNARGWIEIYSEDEGCVFLVSPTTITSARSGYAVILPSSAGTLALVGDNNHTHSQYLPKSTVTGSPDLDSYTTTGIYTINTSTATHSPTTNYSTLFVDGSVGTPFQILKPDANDTTWYTRHRNNSAGTWYSWVALNLNGISKSDLYTILWSGSTSCTARSSTEITLTTAISANKYRMIKVVWNCGTYTGVSEFRADTLNVTNNIPSSSDATTMNIIQFKVTSDGKKVSVGPGTTTITVLQIAGVYPI